MAILIDETTKVICQGLTGRTATFHGEQAIAYGTNLVAGVTPGKGGRRHLGLPIFDSVAEAREATGAEASAVFVPPAHAAAAMIEAIEAGIETIACVTERIPVLDMLRVRAALEGTGCRLVGPNSQGVISPGKAKIGVMPSHPHRPGRVGVVSRSASLTYEAVEQLGRCRLGQSTSVGIGGDPVTGMDFKDCLALFFADPGTDGVLLIGEIGGRAEEGAAQFLESAGNRKPVAAYIAGRIAPPARRMGHAGTFDVLGEGDAESKIAALAAAGVTIAPSPAHMGETMARVLQRAG